MRKFWVTVLLAAALAAIAAGCAPSPPQATAAPVVQRQTVFEASQILGVASTVGGTLTATAGTWTGNPTTFVFQWQDCNSTATTCTNITGATATTHAQTTTTTYTIASGDVGFYVRVGVVASSSISTSAETFSAVTPQIGTPPANTSAPAVTGTPTSGSVLTSTTGTWSGSPTSYSYQWQDCNSTASSCTNITGATASTYTLVTGDVGFYVRSTVKATNANGTSATAANSAVTAVISAGGTIPSNSAPPTVSGSTTTGSVLTSTNGTWTGSPTGYSYQWQDCNSSASSCTNITGATASTYTLVSGDVGFYLRDGVKATNGSGTSATTYSAVTAIVTAAAGCDLNATTANFASQFTALTSGQTLCLASGSYGTFTGGTKSGRVTVQPAVGASVNMTINFNGATNITVTGMTYNGVTLQGPTANVTIANGTVPSSSQVVVLTDSMNASSNLVLNGLTVDNQDCTDFGLAGRIHVEDAGDNNEDPVGLIIENSTLSGGTSDGVRLDSGSGIQVLNNTFTNFDDVDPCHTDDIQFAGSSGGDIIKGNFFYVQASVADCSISVFNGADHLTIENNVVAGNASAGCGGTGGGDGAMALYGDEDSTIEHNVLGMPGLCGGSPCDVGLNFANEGSDVAGTGTVFKDNIMTGVSNGDTTHGTTYSENHNDCTDGNCSSTGDLGTGTGDISGTPVFVGGAHPSTWAGFALASGSPGIAAASDGTNMGIELPTGG